MMDGVNFLQDITLAEKTPRRFGEITAEGLGGNTGAVRTVAASKLQDLGRNVPFGRFTFSA